MGRGMGMAGYRPVFAFPLEHGLPTGKLPAIAEKRLQSLPSRMALQRKCPRDPGQRTLLSEQSRKQDSLSTSFSVFLVLPGLQGWGFPSVYAPPPNFHQTLPLPYGRSHAKDSPGLSSADTSAKSLRFISLCLGKWPSFLSSPQHPESFPVTFCISMSGLWVLFPPDLHQLWAWRNLCDVGLSKHSLDLKIPRVKSKKINNLNCLKLKLLYKNLSESKKLQIEDICKAPIW